MATELKVIQNFMKVLTGSKGDSSKHATKSLDDAVYYASNGRFTSLQDAIDTFADGVAYANQLSLNQKKRWLAENCGIIMDNEDTGALTGQDAGGTLKTSKSVVNENGNSYYGSYPSSSTVIGGVEFEWPDASSLSSRQQQIICRLKDNWLPAAVKLVKETYDVNFSSDKIVVSFENVKNNTLAHADYRWKRSTGTTYNYELVVNEYNFANLDLSSEDGDSGESSGKIDRTLAHELTHSLMDMGIQYVNEVPAAIMEGLAEATHGADDFRYNAIYSSLNLSKEYIKYVLNCEQSGTDNNYTKPPEEVYPVGYMFIRYLARECATSGVPNYQNDPEYLPYYGQYYRKNRSEVIVKRTSEKIDTVNLNNYAETVTRLDASNYNYEGMDIIGSDRSETFILSNFASHITPGGGNDVIYDYNYDKYCGKRYYFGNNDGTNIISGFNGGKQRNQDYESRIYLTKGVVDGISYSNGILKIWSDNTDIAVHNITKRYSDSELHGLKIIDSLGNANVYRFFENGDTVWYCDENTWKTKAIIQMDTSSQYFYSYDKKKVRLTNKFSGNVDINKFYNTVTSINASDVTSNLTITGNSGISAICLGKGNDTLIYGKGMGDEYIYNFNSGDQVKSKNGSVMVTAGAAGNDLYLCFGSAGSASYTDRAILKGMYGKTFKYNGQTSLALNRSIGETITYGKGMGDEYIYNFNSGDQVKSKNGSVMVTAGAAGNDLYLCFGSAGSTSYTDRAILKGMYGKTFKYNGQTSLALNRWTNETITYGKGMGDEYIYNFNSGDQVKSKSGSAMITAGAVDNDLYLCFGSAGSTSYTDRAILKGMYGKTFKYNGQTSLALNRSIGETITYGKGMGDEYIYNFNSGDQVKSKSGSAMITAGAAGNDLYLCFGSAGSTSYTDRVILKGMYGKTFKYNGQTSLALNRWVSETITYGKGMGDEVVYNFNDGDQIRTKNGSSVTKVSISGRDAWLHYGSGNDILKLVGLAGKTFMMDGKRTTIRMSNGRATMFVDNSSGSAYQKSSLNYLTQVQSNESIGSSLALDTNLMNKNNNVHLAYAHC